MHNSNCSNLFLQQETIHVDGILSACERGITWYSMKMSNFVIWYEGKGLFPSSRELRHWNDLRVWKISVFSLWKQSHLIFHLPTLPLSPGKRIFLLLAWQKILLGFCFLEVMTSTDPNPFCSTKTIVKEVSFQGFKTAEGSLLHWRMCWDGAILCN